ncbi:MAG: histidinol dehydrogenase [bacterium]
MRISALSSASVAAEVAALRPPDSSNREVADVVARLVADVRTRGDVALVEATARFDWAGASAATLAVTLQELETAYRGADPPLMAALETTRDNCTFFHRHELVADWEDEGAQGQKLGVRHLPVERSGLYVPGGLGAYASTVMMNAVPARVAGVKELIICTPPGRDGSVDRSVLAAARLMGVERVFRVGGAQAIAAMAYGTETIPRVDVICGPGNAYVMEAKRQVYGAVGIDNLAGPSEVLVVADNTARPSWIAADMLAQEEHGSGAQAVLLAESLALCAEVGDAVARLRQSAAPGAEPAAPDAGAASTAAGGPGGTDSQLVAFYPSAGEDFLELAAVFIDAYAPEHLELHLADPRGFLPRVRSAGAVFLGQGTPTAFGDYVAGSNHVLPTGGSARFSSPLSVHTFMRRSSYVEMPPGTVVALAPDLATLAEAEGFPFHRISVELRVPDGE